MHPALRIPEILSLIFYQLRLTNEIFSKDVVRERRRTLAALAKTCRVICEPALDELWYEQTTLENFFKCLPADSWEKTGAHAPLRLIRPLRLSDWDGPKRYRLRVRSLQSFDGRPSAEVLAAWTTAFRDEPIFPRLHTLSTTTNWHANLNYVLHEGLQKLNLHCKDESLDNVPTLPLPLSTLETLIVYGDSQKVLAPWWSQASKELVAIREVLFQLANWTIWRHLAAHPHLAKLSLRVDQELGFPVILADDPQPFPALSSLDLESERIGEAIALVESVSDWDVAELVVRASQTESETPAGLFRGIGSRFRLDRLRRLLVTIWLDVRLGVDDDQRFKVDRETFAGLFRFTHMINIELKFPAGFDFDDELVWELARSWTCLEFLNLQSSLYYAMPSIDALRAFATHCPALEHLELAVDATNIPEAFEPNAGRGSPAPVRQLALSHFVVADSPVDDPAEVAHFLAGLFPSLRTIEADNEDGYFDSEEPDEDDDDHDIERRAWYHRWMQVAKILAPARDKKGEEGFYLISSFGSLIRC
ncbi:hypothetical protein MKEN_00197800 [Mycena kentingensis (nom. inval.)]|nr:hypothetical protein MKEN_00197800 [Mycena kentingensis (nom. inval.)]